MFGQLLVVPERRQQPVDPMLEDRGHSARLVDTTGMPLAKASITDVGMLSMSGL